MYHSAGIALENLSGSADRAKAIIFGRKEQVGDICRLIENSYSQVTLTETSRELEKSGLGKEPFRLAVMTDSFSEQLSIGLLIRVRQKFAPENMICLTRDIEEENEKKLRSAGLIFLGSYGNFLAHADNIINHTLSRFGNTALKPEIKLAVNPEKTINAPECNGRNRRKRLFPAIGRAVSRTELWIIMITAALAAAIFLCGIIK